MTRRIPSPLRDVRARSVDAGLLISWSCARRVPVTVRVLRGDQWFPQTPDDHACGAWQAQLVYEGEGSACIDTDANPAAEHFYSIFTRRRREWWSQAVQIHQQSPTGLAANPGSGGAVGAEGGGVLVYGSREGARPGASRREALSIALPAVFAAAMVAALATHGVAHRCALAGTWTAIAAWRQHEGPTQDDDVFAKWLLAPVGLVAAAALARVTMAFMLPTATAFFGGHDIVWFVLTVVATIGEWMAAGRAVALEARDDRRAPRVALLTGPALFALAWPAGATAAMAAVAVLDAGHRLLARQSRSRQMS